jgi:hypothetical protein
MKGQCHKLRLRRFFLLIRSTSVTDSCVFLIFIIFFFTAKTLESFDASPVLTAPVEHPSLKNDSDSGELQGVSGIGNAFLSSSKHSLQMSLTPLKHARAGVNYTGEARLTGVVDTGKALTACLYL